jgi:hypothetical protein
VTGRPLLDLKYDEDSRAAVDMNVVCTGDNRFIEVQGTAEGEPYTRAEMDELLALASTGLEELFAAQRAAIAPPPPPERAGRGATRRETAASDHGSTAQPFDARNASHANTGNRNTQE